MNIAHTRLSVSVSDGSQIMNLAPEVSAVLKCKRSSDMSPVFVPDAVRWRLSMISGIL